MTRSSLHVRPAVLADLPVLVEFGRDLREQLAALAQPPTRSQPVAEADVVLEQRYREAIEDPGRHLVLCLRAGEEPLGMALLTVAPVNALRDEAAVHLSHAVVPGRHRRRGAGKALVSAAADYAESRGLEQIVVSVPPGARDVNRFYARLGFAPYAVRRVSTVSTVRRRLVEVRTPPSADVPRSRRDLRASARLSRRRPGLVAATTMAATTVAATATTAVEGAGTAAAP